MSGRKDYEYELEQRRQQAALAAIQERREQRSARTRERLERAKRQAAQQATEVQAMQRARTQQRMSEAAAKTAVAISSSKAQAKAAAARNSAKSERDELAAKQASLAEIRLAEEQKAASEKQALIDQQVTTEVENLLRWQENLAGSEETQSFAYSQAQSWSVETKRLVATVGDNISDENTLQAMQQHLRQAEQIENDAGEISDRYFARNEVLQDIIGSLKEIGFFVQDPEFVDADHPDGGVIIRASRGDQTMMTQVDLDQTVQSDWQGIHGEYCTDGFFEFVKAMGVRGVEISPDNPKLKPRLLQKGAKDFPGNNQRSRGQR